MTYGLRVRDNDGNLRLDTGDKVGRLVHRAVLTAGSAGTISVPGYDDSNSVIVTARLGGVGIGAIDETIGAHLAEWDPGGTVSYYPSTSSATDFAPSLLLVIAFGDT